ncbi:endopeptidase La [bacterium CPR1]|nr:endopeptidase La [bacterium CPR1]
MARRRIRNVLPLPEPVSDEPAQREVELMALKEVVLFPHLIMPLLVGREPSVRALERALEHERGLFVVTQREPGLDQPGRRDLYTVGTYCSILQALRLPEGGYRVVVQGLERARILRTLQSKPFFRVNIRLLAERGASEEAARTGMQVVLNQFRQAVDLGKDVPPELLVALMNITDPGHLADVIGFHLDTGLAEKQVLLECAHAGERLRLVSVHLSRELEVLKIENRLQSRAEREMEKGQREYFLRQQLRAIQEELGSGDEDEEEVRQLADTISRAELPGEVREHAEKELKKLERTPLAAAERTVLSTYLDWLLQVPWSARTEDQLDLKRAAACLDEDHFGLQDVKERILEFLAVRQLAGAHKGPILCFVGPPGVGKTSLGRSIARALSRKFHRTSLGGVRDEAEIRGHRRTYVGAFPGRIVQCLCQTRSKNPVLVLDEIDKLGLDFRGDPSAALLEALDPEQNKEFKDHYLGVTVDLSEVMFLLTANLLDPVPPALRDRMEVIRLPGYTEEEKIRIALGFLVPRQLEAHGLSTRQLCLPEETVRSIIRNYTREAGVRHLDRQIARLCRKRARQVVEKELGRRPGPVLPRHLEKRLGVPTFEWGADEREPRDLPGAARGLSWTSVGGEVLLIEANLTEGKGRLILTGSLGQVMKESARAAATWVRSYCGRQGIAFDYYAHDLHLHVPSGAIPKDGPSAGITMATALVSALTRRPVDWNVVMTGEITLRGRVMPVGGIKEKVLAAYNAGVQRVVLPRANQKNLQDVPENVKSRLDFVFAEGMEEVLAVALPALASS